MLVMATNQTKMDLERCSKLKTNICLCLYYYNSELRERREFRNMLALIRMNNNVSKPITDLYPFEIEIPSWWYKSKA